MSGSATLLPEAQSYTELENAGNELAGWLWQGFIAFGSISLLTSRWKMGKTTRLSVLLSRLRTGGELAGCPRWRHQRWLSQKKARRCGWSAADARRLEPTFAGCVGHLWRSRTAMNGTDW
jgi:hypothetical protein